MKSKSEKWTMTYDNIEIIMIATEIKPNHEIPIIANAYLLAWFEENKNK